MSKNEFKKQLKINNDLNKVMQELDEMIFRYRIFKNIDKYKANVQNFKNIKNKKNWTWS